MNILFFGTPDFSVPTLQALTRMPDIRVGAVITQPNKPSGRGGEVRPPSVKTAAMELSIPVFQPRSLRKEFTALRPRLAELGPFDIGIVIAFGQILPIEVLTFPTKGCVNIHASLLPRWRGAAPIQRAIEAGDQKTGVCLMQMDEGLDTGPVFSSAEISISADETAQSLHDSLAKLGASLLERDLEKIASGTITACPQPSTGATYAAKVTAQDCHIDWSRPAKELKRAIQAFSPFPGAFTVLNGRRLKIYKAREISRDSSRDYLPGFVRESSGESLIVQCGAASCLALEEIQAEGKKRMAVRDFLRGSAIAVGSHLGQ